MQANESSNINARMTLLIILFILVLLLCFVVVSIIMVFGVGKHAERRREIFRKAHLFCGINFIFLVLARYIDKFCIASYNGLSYDVG